MASICAFKLELNDELREATTGSRLVDSSESSSAEGTDDKLSLVDIASGVTMVGFISKDNSMNALSRFIGDNSRFLEVRFELTLTS